MKFSEQFIKQIKKTAVADAKRALYEDLNSLDPEADLTAHLLARHQEAEAIIFSRVDAVLCGTFWFNQACWQIDKSLKMQWLLKDGEVIYKNRPFCMLKGNVRSILTAERTALNFLQTLSATATSTRQYVNKVSGWPVKILDTRKTIPGLRMAQKYAVLCGGGHNHRFGLYDAILIKENHLHNDHLQNLIRRVAIIKNHQPETPLIIEVETLEELQLALQSQADRILLDNFSPDDLVQAVALNKEYNAQQKLAKPDSKAKLLEVSGNVTLDNVAAIARTGIDYISIGALTKNINAVDMSCLFVDPSL